LKDLCARLPYGVKAYVKNWSKLDRKYYEGIYNVMSLFPSLNEVHVQSKTGSVDVMLGYTNTDYVIKPYLIPLSSMTEEQMEELEELCDMYTPDDDYNPYAYKGIKVIYKHVLDDNYEFNFKIDVIDWFNKNHFDYRGLIKKGIAIDATNLDIY
jgi:hypothetical protein